MVQQTFGFELENVWTSQNAERGERNTYRKCEFLNSPHRCTFSSSTGGLPGSCKLSLNGLEKKKKKRLRQQGMKRIEKTTLTR